MMKRPCGENPRAPDDVILDQSAPSYTEASEHVQPSSAETLPPNLQLTTDVLSMTPARATRATQPNLLTCEQ